MSPHTASSRRRRQPSLAPTLYARWGGLFAHEDAAARLAASEFFKQRCLEKHVLPYFTPGGGFMLTPRYDDEPEALGAAVADLAECALATTREMGWARSKLITAGR